jgi:hypothetical protein
MVVKVADVIIILNRAALNRIYFFNISQSISFQIMPARNMIMAMALMACITFRLKLVGRLGSFLRKKYMNKFTKKEGSPSNRRAL